MLLAVLVLLHSVLIHDTPATIHQSSEDNSTTPRGHPLLMGSEGELDILQADDSTSWHASQMAPRSPLSALLLTSMYMYYIK